MRREGFEVSISRPKVLLERDETAKRSSRSKKSSSTSTKSTSGIVVQKLSERKAEMTDMRPSGGGHVRLVFHAPTRGLIGYQGELLTDTRGTAVMNRLFHDYGAYTRATSRPPQRRADLQRPGRIGRLRAVEPGRPRADDDRAGLEGLSAA